MATLFDCSATGTWKERLEQLKHLDRIVDQKCPASATSQQRAALCQQFSRHHLVFGLKKQLKDLRSTVVKQACIVVSTIATNLGRHFDVLADQLVATLLTLLGKPHPLVVRTAAKRSMAAVLGCCKRGLPSALRSIINGCAARGNPEIRCHAVGLLEQILREWDVASYSKSALGEDPKKRRGAAASAPLATAVAKALSDSLEETRSLGRRCIQILRLKVPDAAVAIEAQLSKRVRETLPEWSPDDADDDIPAAPVTDASVDEDEDDAHSATAAATQSGPEEERSADAAPVEVLLPSTNDEASRRLQRRDTASPTNIAALMAALDDEDSSDEEELEEGEIEEGEEEEEEETTAAAAPTDDFEGAVAEKAEAVEAPGESPTHSRVNATTETELEAEVEVEAEVETEAEVKVETEVEVEVEDEVEVAEVKVEAEAEVEVEAEVQVEVETKAEVESEAEVELEAEVQVEAEVEMEASVEEIGSAVVVEEDHETVKAGAGAGQGDSEEGNSMDIARTPATEEEPVAATSDDTCAAATEQGSTCGSNTCNGETTDQMDTGSDACEAATNPSSPSTCAGSGGGGDTSGDTSPSTPTPAAVAPATDPCRRSSGRKRKSPDSDAPASCGSSVPGAGILGPANFSCKTFSLSSIIYDASSLFKTYQKQAKRMKDMMVAQESALNQVNELKSENEQLKQQLHRQSLSVSGRSQMRRSSMGF